jgi:hypothetical protein
VGALKAEIAAITPKLEASTAENAKLLDAGTAANAKLLDAGIAASAKLLDAGAAANAKLLDARIAHLDETMAQIMNAARLVAENESHKTLREYKVRVDSSFCCPCELQRHFLLSLPLPLSLACGSRLPSTRLLIARCFNRAAALRTASAFFLQASVMGGVASREDIK